MMEEGTALSYLLSNVGKSAETRTFTYLLLAIVAAASRCIMSEERRTLAGYLRALVLAFFTAIIVGEIIDGKMPQSMQNAVVGLAAYIADDLLFVVIRCGQFIRKDPLGILRCAIVNWLGLGGGHDGGNKK